MSPLPPTQVFLFSVKSWLPLPFDHSSFVLFLRSWITKHPLAWLHVYQIALQTWLYVPWRQRFLSFSFCFSWYLTLWHVVGVKYFLSKSAKILDIEEGISWDAKTFEGICNPAYSAVNLHKFTPVLISRNVLWKTDENYWVKFYNLLIYFQIWSTRKYILLYSLVLLLISHFSTFFFFLNKFFLKTSSSFILCGEFEGQTLLLSPTPFFLTLWIRRCLYFLVRVFRLLCFRRKISFELNLFGSGSRLMIGLRVKSTYCPMTEWCDF